MYFVVIINPYTISVNSDNLWLGCTVGCTVGLIGVDDGANQKILQHKQPSIQL